LANWQLPLNNWYGMFRSPIRDNLLYWCSDHDIWQNDYLTQITPTNCMSSWHSYVLYSSLMPRAGLRLWGALGPNILWGPFTHIHGCTYCLKSGWTKWGTEGAAAGVEGSNGGFPLPSRLGGLRKRRKLPQRGTRRRAGDLEIFCILMLSDGLSCCGFN